MNCYTPASSGTTNGISWISPATTTTWTLYQNGDKLTGSGTYVAAGITYSYTFDLVVAERYHTVVNGNTVKVDYVGKLPDGRVFDTSLASVANDASVPKSLSFVLRSNSSYSPLSFTVGSGSLIAGFNNAVIGMKIGETKTVTIPPSEAYGNLVLSKVTNFNLTETKNVYENMSFSQFITKYSVTAVAGMTVTDPVYKWPVKVLLANSDADIVRIQNSPVQGQSYLIYSNTAQKATGWNITVTSVNPSISFAGQIVLVHDITDLDAGRILGVDLKGTAFILDNVNISAGTASRNTNSELVGKTLTFTIILDKILGLIETSPQGLIAVPGDSHVLLYWTKPYTDAGSNINIDYYVVYQNGTVLSGNAKGLFMNVTNLTNGMTYYFAVAAHNSNGIGLRSEQVFSTPNKIPTAPSGLTFASSKSSMNLNWGGVSLSTSYNIYRGNSSDSMILIGHCALTGYNDPTVRPGSTYYYSVSAINSAGEGPRSEALKGTTLTTLKGTIVNAYGLPLSGITVTLENGTSTQTNITGGYEFAVSPGTHELTISGSGIQTMKVPVNAQNQGSTIGPITTSADTNMSTLSTMALVVIAVSVIIIAIVVIAMYARRRGK
ncbi:MAG TPA: FKBP-type peptidyl-prolyl cis-trans isomerase [Methanomassiliicoccales archaeon]